MCNNSKSGQNLNCTSEQGEAGQGSTGQGAGRGRTMPHKGKQVKKMSESGYLILFFWKEVKHDHHLCSPFLSLLFSLAFLFTLSSSILLISSLICFISPSLYLSSLLFPFLSSSLLLPSSFLLFIFPLYLPSFSLHLSSDSSLQSRLSV